MGTVGGQGRPPLQPMADRRRRTGCTSRRSDDGRAEKIPPSFQGVAAAVLYGLGQMRGLDTLRALQIGDGARHAQDAVVAASRQPQTVEGALHELLSGGVQRAVLTDHGRGHVGVAGDIGAGVALFLHLTGGVDPRPDIRRGLRLLLAAHGLVLHGGHVDVHVDAVQQGARNAAHVLLYLLGRAGTAAGGMTVPPAAAGVHGTDQHEAAGQRQGAGGAGDGHKAVLQRLAQRLQRRLAELRQLVQKQHAVVRQGYLAGAGDTAAAGQGDGGGRVVGAAEGAGVHQRVGGVGHARHRVDLRSLQRLSAGHVRQDGGQPPRQHGLARAGGVVSV